MQIQPLSTNELALNNIHKGLNPDYTADCYRANAASMRKAAARLSAKIAAGNPKAKSGGYTLAELEESARRSEENAVAVSKRMRELHAQYPRLIQFHPMCDYQRTYTAKS